MSMPLGSRALLLAALALLSVSPCALARRSSVGHRAGLGLKCTKVSAASVCGNVLNWVKLRRDASFTKPLDEEAATCAAKIWKTHEVPACGEAVQALLDEGHVTQAFIDQAGELNEHFVPIKEVGLLGTISDADVQPTCGHGKLNVAFPSFPSELWVENSKEVGEQTRVKCPSNSRDPSVTVLLECAETSKGLQWQLKSGTCEPKHQTCHASNFTLSWKGTERPALVFELPMVQHKLDIGKAIAHPEPCKDAKAEGGEAASGGTAIFSCSPEGRWKVASEDCEFPSDKPKTVLPQAPAGKSCEETNLALEMDDDGRDVMTYHLHKDVLGARRVEACGSGYGGFVTLECLEDGWDQVDNEEGTPYCYKADMCPTQKISLKLNGAVDVTLRFTLKEQELSEEVVTMACAEAEQAAGSAEVQGWMEFVCKLDTDAGRPTWEKVGGGCKPA